VGLTASAVLPSPIFRGVLEEGRRDALVDAYVMHDDLHQDRSQDEHDDADAAEYDSTVQERRAPQQGEVGRLRLDNVADPDLDLVQPKRCLAGVIPEESSPNTACCRIRCHPSKQGTQTRSHLYRLGCKESPCAVQVAGHAPSVAIDAGDLC